ncbi:hypothetical protein [Desulfocurvus sp. DL9XJH121]
MDIEKSLFRIDSYDFFGYLAPGILSFMAIIVSSVQVIKKYSMLEAIDHIIVFANKLDMDVFIFLSIIFIISSYVVGHLTGSMSSSLFEKTIVGKIFGYPYSSIIFNKETNQSFSSWYYRAFISLVYLVSLLYVACGFNIKIKFDALSMNFILYPYCVVGTVLIVLVFMKSIDTRVTIKITEDNKFHRFMFLLCKIFGHPFYITERINYHFQGQIRTFPKPFVEKIKVRYKELFGVELTEEVKTEAYWAIFWFVSNSNVFVRDRLNKWLVLYGFMRNMSFSALISSIIIVVPKRFVESEGLLPVGVGLVLLVLSVVFSFRYYYLYFGYYSKTIFRVFAYGEGLTPK